MTLATSTERSADAPEAPVSRDPARVEPRSPGADGTGAEADGGPVYTVTEAARLARVSVQALRQRIARGTLGTTRVVRDRRTVTAVPRDELLRAYPELAEASTRDVELILHGEPSAPPPAPAPRSSDRTRKLVAQLRLKLAKEREERARLEGVARDQERRLEELLIERMRLERRVAELDNRLVFLDGLPDDLPPTPAWWRRGAVWARIAVVAAVLSTFLAAGGAYWEQLDARFQALASALSASRADAAAESSTALADR